MNSIRNIKTAYVMYSAILVILGLSFAFAPDISMKTICYVIGVTAVICGVVKMVGYFINDSYGLAFQFDFALGIITILVALTLFIYPKGIVSFVDILLGLFVLIDGAFKLQTSIEAKSFGINKWWIILLTALLTVVAGMILVLNPYSSMLMLTRLLGVAFVLDGVLNLIVALYTVKLIKRFSPILTESEEMEVR